MATYLIAGGTCVVAVALVPTVARILSKVLPANDKPGTPAPGHLELATQPPLPPPPLLSLYRVARARPCPLAFG